MGGMIQTLHRDGFVIEKGPDSFLARKTAMVDLAKELEIDHELVSQNPESKKPTLCSAASCIRCLQDWCLAYLRNWRRFCEAGWCLHKASCAH